MEELASTAYMTYRTDINILAILLPSSENLKN
jgi:hypothetical protein